MSENRIIDRDYGQHILQNICEEDVARQIAVSGRCRVGKTYLVQFSSTRSSISSSQAVLSPL